MTKIKINKEWTLYVLEYNENSVMENHGVMEIAADNERKNLFAHELMVRTYGLDSVVNSAKKYTTTR